MEDSLDLRILERITHIPTASFFEDLVRTECEIILSELFENNSKVNIRRDKYGNVIAHY